MKEKILIPSHTSLPDLPRTIKKREASITPRVLEWFRTNYTAPCALEIKATQTGSIPASALAPHQRIALLDATTARGIAHKLSDEARRQQPFDAFVLKGCAAFVVACFPKRGICYAVPIKEWRGVKLSCPPSSSAVLVLDL